VRSPSSSEVSRCWLVISYNKLINGLCCIEQVSNVRHRDKTSQRKFSTLIKRMIVELERDPQQYADGNIVEVCSILYQVIMVSEMGG
jgi:hypothetical protein